jgi:hypothetical protein
MRNTGQPISRPQVPGTVVLDFQRLAQDSVSGAPTCEATSNSVAHEHLFEGGTISPAPVQEARMNFISRILVRWSSPRLADPRSFSRRQPRRFQALATNRFVTPRHSRNRRERR